MTEITLETDKEFISNKGTEFEIVIRGTGNYQIKMKRGGNAPKICEGKYTSRAEAEKVLERYLKHGDRTGYAVYPSKVNGKSKDK